MMKLKRLGRISVCMTVLMVMLLAAGCRKSSNSSEESANAVLNQFLSGTVQVADEFDSQYAEIASAETDDETDMISVNGMDDYFQKQFGEIMTDACISDLMANRSMIAPMKLAQQLDKDIIAQDIQLTAKSGEENAYDFSAQLVTSDDKQPVGTAEGYVKMQSDNSNWKAAALTIKITTD
ncbi:hypothetical protein [Dialister sp.]|uniref:hypothetical protein n=1 Tax=Dialister sp. TaxID=1955814 RepID=UPI003FA67A67